MNDLHIDVRIILKREERIVWHNPTIIHLKVLSPANPHCVSAPALRGRSATIHRVGRVAEERSTGEWLWEGLGTAPRLTFTLHARRVGVDASAWAVNIASGDDVKEFRVGGYVGYFR